MEGLNSVVDDILVVEGFHQILSHVSEVGIKNLSNVVQLITNTA